LVTGGSGKLGSQLKPLLSNGLFPTHQNLDITKKDDVADYILRESVDTLIHCAALTNIRYCEEHREEAFNINVNGTRALIEALASKIKQPYFIYVSTACVFPGDSSRKYYSEEDVPYPKNFYAVTKLISECVSNSFSKSLDVLVLRTNFIERKKWPYPKAFTDRFATYLYSDQVASAIKDLVEKRKTGLVHISGDKKMSMFEFARLSDPEVQPMTLKDYSGPPLTINMSLTSMKTPLIHFDPTRALR
jgi:dTDP-4-dehydrorhamnose reductase